MRVKCKNKQDEGLLRFSFPTFSLGHVTWNCEFSSSLFSLPKQLTVSRCLRNPTTAVKRYDYNYESQTIFWFSTYRLISLANANLLAIVFQETFIQPMLYNDIITLHRTNCTFLYAAWFSGSLNFLPRIYIYVIFDAMDLNTNYLNKL